MEGNKGHTLVADAVFQQSELFLLRYDLVLNGDVLLAGTPIHKNGNEWFHSHNGTRILIESDSYVCRAEYKGVTLSELRCDDAGLFFARRIGAVDFSLQVDSRHVGFQLSRGAGCVCVFYGGRYFPLEFFGW